MTTYNIDFTDPLKTGFQIVPGAYNGPGSANPQTSLRLYGRGALEWGESVDEDLVRLLENSASATPPQLRSYTANDVCFVPPLTAPLFGQLWFRCKLYKYDTVLANWYRWDYSTQTWIAAVPLGTTWQVTDVNTVAPFRSPACTSAPFTGGLGDPAIVNPALQTIGNYIWDQNGGAAIPTDPQTQKLYRWDQFYKEYSATWLEREYEIVSDGVTPTGLPTCEMLVWNGGAWTVPGGATVSTTPPVPPQPGQLWFNPTTCVLSVWNSCTSTWDQIVTVPFANITYLRLDGTNSMSGILDMGGFRIINLGTPTLATDAATKGYTDSAITTALGGATGPFLKLDGTNTPTTGVITLGANLNANSNKVLNLATPTSGSDGANKTYVDMALHPDSGTVGTPATPVYFASLAAPTNPQGNDGDLWFQYV